MRGHAIIAAALLAVGAAPAAAQEVDYDNDGALAAVGAFLDAFGKKDADAMRALVTDKGFLAMVEERDGPDRTVLRDLHEVIAALAASPGTISEPIWGERTMADGPVAMVWANYDVYLNGKHSHCGVDIFTLMRVDNVWKISTITYSHVKDPCLMAGR